MDGDLNSHCMDGEYSKREKRLTCKHCGKPLLDNDLVKDSFAQNTTVGWAKTQLRILSEMSESKGLLWLSMKLRETSEGLNLLREEQVMEEWNRRIELRGNRED